MNDIDRPDQYAEACCIGSILLDKSHYWDVAELIGVNDFCYPPAKILWLAMSELADEGKPIDDVVLLRDRLGLSPFGDESVAEVICRLVDYVPTGVHAAHYAKVVAENSAQRQLRAVIQTAAEREGTFSEQKDWILGQIDKIVKREREHKSIKEAMVDNREAQSNVRITTGYDTLDDALGGGLKGGRYCVIGATPGTGKTELAMNLALSMRREDKAARTLIISLEMRSDEIEDRLTANIGEIPKGASEALREGRALSSTREMYYDRYMKAVDDLAARPIILWRPWQLTREGLDAKLAQLSGEFDCCILDYLQLIKRSHPRERQFETVTEASILCKQLARRHDIPFIAVSQLSRSSGKEARYPVISDLRQSGQIEQDADQVILLWRPHERGASDELMRVDLAKNRGGQTVVFKLPYNMVDGRIGNIWNGEEDF